MVTAAFEGSLLEAITDSDTLGKNVRLFCMYYNTGNILTMTTIITLITMVIMVTMVCCTFMWWSENAVCTNFRFYYHYRQKAEIKFTRIVFGSNKKRKLCSKCLTMLKIAQF